jgi:hypothetical protein
LAPHTQRKFSWPKQRYGLLLIKRQNAEPVTIKADERAVTDAQGIAKSKSLIDIVT